MPNSSLIFRLKNHEDNFVERKPEGVNAADIRRTMVAFANSVPAGRTGVLFIGISDSGFIHGVQNTDKLQKTVRDQCENVCYPPVAFSTSVIEEDGKAVLAIVVPSSGNKPHFSGPAYVRKGSESVAASPELFDELIASRNSKVAAILLMRAAPISVFCVQHKLGSTERVSDSSSRTYSECIVENCSLHTVRLKDTGSDRHFTEPIENVTVSFDDDRHCPALIVRD
jgi:hypothetical protein